MVERGGTAMGVRFVGVNRCDRHALSAKGRLAAAAAAAAAAAEASAADAADAAAAAAACGDTTAAAVGAAPAVADAICDERRRCMRNE